MIVKNEKIANRPKIHKYPNRSSLNKKFLFLYSLENNTKAKMLSVKRKISPIFWNLVFCKKIILIDDMNRRVPLILCILGHGTECCLLLNSTRDTQLPHGCARQLPQRGSVSVSAERNPVLNISLATGNL